MNASIKQKFTDLAIPTLRIPGGEPRTAAERYQRRHQGDAVHTDQVLAEVPDEKPEEEKDKDQVGAADCHKAALREGLERKQRGMCLSKMQPRRHDAHCAACERRARRKT